MQGPKTPWILQDLLDVECSYTFSCTPAQEISFFFLFAGPGEAVLEHIFNLRKGDSDFFIYTLFQISSSPDRRAIKELNRLEPGPRTASTVLQNSLCRNKTIYRNVQYRDLIFPPPSIYIIHEMKLKLICTAALK